MRLCLYFALLDYYRSYTVWHGKKGYWLLLMDAAGFGIKNLSALQLGLLIHYLMTLTNLSNILLWLIPTGSTDDFSVALCQSKALLSHDVCTYCIIPGVITELFTWSCFVIWQELQLESYCYAITHSQTVDYFREKRQIWWSKTNEKNVERDGNKYLVESNKPSE